MIDDSYVDEIRERTTRRDQLEQLAEEAAELSQAALKLIRAEGLSGSPTPVSVEEARQALRGEIADVRVSLRVLEEPDDSISILELMNQKLRRWLQRLTRKDFFVKETSDDSVRVERGCRTQSRGESGRTGGADVKIQTHFLRPSGRMVRFLKGLLHWQKVPRREPPA